MLTLLVSISLIIIKLKLVLSNFIRVKNINPPFSLYTFNKYTSLAMSESGDKTEIRILKTRFDKHGAMN